MSPEDQLVQPTPKPHKTRVSERALQRQRLLGAQQFCQEISLLDPKVRFRYRMGMRTGDLHPSIERAVLEIAYGKASEIDERLLAAVGTAAGAGLINLVLRKALTEDPLAEARVIDAKVEREPALPALTAAQVESIVPPARPAKKPKGSGPGLKPGEEVMP